jgi:hypothetical protein
MDVRAWAVSVALSLATMSCGGGNQKEAAAPASNEPAWADTFEKSPSLMAVLHPQAIRRDPVYGPLLTQASQKVAGLSAAVAATRELEAFESAEEIVIAVWDDGHGTPNEPSSGHQDALVVVRGVRADVDPARVVDAAGHTLWQSAGVGGRVPELVRTESGETASLFTLPHRTWVIALGAARDRARVAFANPSGRPAIKYDHDALLSLRLYGPAVVDRFVVLQRGKDLDALGAKLGWVGVALAPGKDGAVVVSLEYTDDEAAARAEVVAKHVVDVVSRDDQKRMRLLAHAEITRDDPRIVVGSLLLPPGFLRDLAGAKAVDVAPSAPSASATSSIVTH